MPFHDRRDSGRKLAEALDRYRGQRPVIVALPRGGVPVAAEVARAFEVPLYLMIVGKIGVPNQPELAIGAIADGIAPIVNRNEAIIKELGISEAAFEAAKDVELAEIRRRHERDAHAQVPANLKGRTIIVVDDGIATGATMRATLMALRSLRPRRLVAVVPAGAISALASLHGVADTIECLETSDTLAAVSTYYEDFAQVSNQEVAEILASLPAASAARR